MKHTMHIGTLFFWNTQSQTRTFLLLLGTVLSSLLWVELAYAKYRVTGSVYAKGVVPSAAGNPYWIEYNALGQALENTAQEAVGDLAPSQVRVLSVQGYKDYQAQYQRLKSDYQDHPNKHLLLVDKNTALNLLIAGTGSGTGTGPADFNSPRYAADHYFAIIPPDSVEGNQYTYAQPQRSIILAAFPINPNDEPPFERGTLLLNTQGETVLSSKNTLGFATAYFVEEGGVTQPTQQYADGTIEPRNRINHSDILINPVRGVSVEMAGSIDQSDSGGRYEVYQPFMLCGVSLSSSGAWVSAMLSYQAFNPNNGSGIYPYFLMKLVPWRCQTLDFLTVGPAAFLGLGVWILAPPTIYPPHHYDIRVDFAAINGRARLFSPGIGRVGVGGDTHYSVSDDAAAQKFTTQTYLYDYDSDGKIDTPVFGRREIDNTGQAVFNTAADIPPAEHVVGVYLSGSGSIPGQDLPDIYREIDTQVSLTDQGLVDTISEEDLKNTDVYFFRESTGQLMAERTGATLANSDKNHHGVGVNDGEFVYTLHVRGPDANRHRSWASYSGSKDVNGKFVGSHNAFEGWQHDSGISPEFRKRDSDFIRPGEYIKIYAINRATGYIGSTRVYLRNPGQMTEEAPYKSLSQMANTIAMRPPNLKIWAERLGVDVANKAGDSQDYTIGNEGAALQSDQQVVVHTEWLDVDDKPLPAGLAGFGYTGRLARLTRDYYPDVLAGQQATFDITPGRHLEVVNVSNMTHTNDHIYVQVSGEPFNREPSFQRDALTPLTNDDEKFTYNNAHNRDGLLQYRPDRYVPFKVQVWDESATVAAQLAYNQAKVQGLASPASLIKPKPVYQWLYRPELQYSLYQLDINAIEREQNGITTDIQNETTPVIGSTDDLLRVLYDLQGSNKKMPGGFSFTGDKKDELIFAIGANEIKATIGDNQQIVFDDLNALALLDVEDFLSLRLYANNDASNVLWEWAFGATGLQVHYKIPAEETLIKAEVIAENNLYRVLGGLRLKYSYLLPSGATNPQFKWHFNDDGGRFCKGWGVGDKNCTKGKTAEGATLSEVYWEPKAWSSSVDVSAILTVSYERNGQKQEKIEQFKVMSRVLKPEATPMKGSDVAMLEQMLWQLGISPSKKPGVSATRLTEEKRNTFEDGDGSVGRMVGRFNYFSHTPINKTTERQYFITTGFNTLDELEKHWRHYVTAYQQYSTLAEYRFDNLSNGDLLAAVAVFDGVVKYPRGPKFTDITPTYTRIIHERVKKYGDFERSDILKAMASKETSGTHWRANYKITVGGSDEAGSSGFNQIQNKYVYGGKAVDGASKGSPCSRTTAYNAANESKVNHYDPGQNLVAKAVWLASGEGDCGSSFYSAFVRKTYTGAYQSQAKPKLLKIQMGAELATIFGATHNDDDDYERLAKSIGAYNQGIATFTSGNGQSWLDLIIGIPVVDSKKRNDIIAKPYKNRTKAERRTLARSTALEYALSILHSGSNGMMNLPYRKYIFAGDYYVDDLLLDDGVTPDPRAGTPEWCFVYGEEHWYLKKTFSSIYASAKSRNKYGKLQVPQGRVSCI